jgi:DNA repair protein RadC
MAILQASSSIITVHNHPSGDPSPSEEDIKLTKRLCEAGKILGIETLDHVIVGTNSYQSLKEMGYIY